MAASSWAMACVWLSLGQAPSGPVVTNQRSLSIPVDIQEARRAEVRELLLFASNDQGRTWQQVAAMMPTQPAFTFTAPIDGVYWLQVAAINRLGKQEPENLYQVAPETFQKVVIDTMKPLLRLNMPQRQGDEILLAWELQEDNPEWTTFRLEYQAKDAGTLLWTPIPATAGLTGQTKFRPTTPATITIRLAFTDKANNQAFTTADAPGTAAVMATGFNNQAPAPGANLPPAPMFPGAPTGAATPPSIVPSLPAQNVPPPGLPIQQAPVAPPIAPPATQEAPRLPLPVVDTMPRTFPMNPPAPNWNASGTNKVDQGKVVASTEKPLVAQVAGSGMPPAKRTLPVLQYVNHPEVTLEYELARVGPSGIGSIELWWTRDDGQTWELYAIDPEGKSGTVANGRHKRTVELQHGDGIYGFILVVKSKAGLGKGPRAGEAPEIRVELDTTSPEADLIEPSPEPGRTNSLQLKWLARDNNLSGTPIVLEWSAKREGPWLPIAPPLANTGRHTWHLPDGLPVQVYMRLRVRDLAGNENIAVTADPQLVDLSEPEGRLVNVSVSPR